MPFCHSGLMIGGLPSGCPLNNLIPEWNDLLYRGEWEAAAQRLLMTNSFPEFTGRVCPAPCEGACTCGIHQPQVTIRQNELSIIENAFASGHMQPHPPATRTGKRVAVVGSGPSGLACANRLNHYGHSVTVLERSDRVGGLLTYGIPNMKLDKRIIARRVDFMRAEGVVFRTGCHVGVDLPAEALLHEFDAVVLCIGSGKPRDLDVPGRKGPGVAFALDYLTAATRAVLDGPETLTDALNAKGKHVIVIGGGDTGTDCVGTALRQGCRSVAPAGNHAQAAPDTLASEPLAGISACAQGGLRPAGGHRALWKRSPPVPDADREILRDEHGVCAVQTEEVRWDKGPDGPHDPAGAARNLKKVAG